MSVEHRAESLASPHLSSDGPPSADSRTAFQWVQWIDDPLICDESNAPRFLGGKGSSLWNLNRAGLPVPPGFTITTAACRYYYEHQRQWPDGLRDEIQTALQQLETITGRQLGRGNRPLTLAVRSGAASSMPGLMSTILHCGLTGAFVRERNEEALWLAFAEYLSGVPARTGESRDPGADVPGWDSLGARQFCERILAESQAAGTTPLSREPEATLRDAICAVFDSWDSPAVRRYRELHASDSEVGTAVTVQAMIECEVAGVMFSWHPAAAHRDQVVVEAVVGSGRSLVSGRSSPARWCLDRESTMIVESVRPPSLATSSAVDSFAAQGLKSLCEALPRIEAMLQGPADVEFGYADGRVIYFQARPLAQSSAVDEREDVRLAEIARLQTWARQGRKLWVRHNLADTLPAPTPLTWDLWRDFMSGRGGFGKLYRQLGYRTSGRVQREGFLELIGGRIYANPERLTEMFGPAYPFSFDPQAMRDDPQAISRPPSRVDLEQLDPWFVWRWPFFLLTMLRASYRQQRLVARAARDFDELTVPALHEYVAQELRIDLSRLSIFELLHLFEQRRNYVFDQLAPRTLLPGTLGAAAWGALEQRLQTILGDSACKSLMRQWVGQIVDPITARSTTLLRDVARDPARVELFLQEFGHRGLNEMDLSAPRWRECPGSLQTSAATMLWSRAAVTDRPAAMPAGRQLQEALREHGAGFLFRELSPLLCRAVSLLPYREIGKHVWLKAYELLRSVIVELSKRWDLGDGIHFLTCAEIIGMREPRDLERLIETRRRQQRICRQLDVPAVIDAAGDLTNFGRRPAAASTGRTFSAMPLNGGQAQGRVRIVYGTEDITNLAPDTVVVATNIEPGLLPFLAGAAALIVEQGGLLSHVALLARQLSIPTVVCPSISRDVQNGEVIQVDADRGLLQLPDRRP